MVAVAVVRHSSTVSLSSRLSVIGRPTNQTAHNAKHGAIATASERVGQPVLTKKEIYYF
jgi:hypothetical protein